MPAGADDCRPRSSAAAARCTAPPTRRHGARGRRRRGRLGRRRRGGRRHAAAADERGRARRRAGDAGLRRRPRARRPRPGWRSAGLDLTAPPRCADALAPWPRAARRPAAAARARPRLGRAAPGPRAARPTRAELDRAPYGGVVYLARVDVHSAVVPRRWPPQAGGRATARLDATTAGSSATPTTRSAGDARGPDRPRPRDRRPAHGPAARPPQPGSRACTSASAPHIARRTTCARRAGALAAADATVPEVVAVPGRAGGRRGAGPRAAAGWGSLAARRRPVRRRRDRLADRLRCARRTPTPPAPAATPTCRAEQIRDHVVACTRAGLQGGLPRDRRRRARRRPRRVSRRAAERVGLAGVRAGAAPGRARRDPGRRGRRRLAELGVVASVQPAFDAAWGGPRACTPRGSGPSGRRGRTPSRRSRRPACRSPSAPTAP